MARSLLLFISIVLLIGDLSAQTKAEKYFLQGRSKYERAGYKASIKWLDKCMALDTTNAAAFAYRGAANLELMKLEKVKIDLDRALRKDPELHFAWYARGRLYTQQFEYEQAIADLDRAIELEPNSPEYHYARALAISAANNKELAVLGFDQVLSIDSTFYKAYRERGTIYAQNGDTAKARTDLDMAISLSPDDPVSYNSRGFHLRAAYGNHLGALEDFNKAIKINPNYAFAFNNRGFARYKLGEVQKGLKDIQNSLKKRGDNPWAYRNLAVIYLEQGHKNEACQNAKRAIELQFNEQYGDEMRLLMKENCRKSKNRPRSRNAP